MWARSECRTFEKCGYQFPYRQGVAINLAPADLRKEGSAFDLPIALELAGCQGQFFGKTLDKIIFLGELSHDGGSEVGAWAAGTGQDDAGQADSNDSAAYAVRRGDRDNAHSYWRERFEGSQGLIGTRPFRSPHHKLQLLGIEECP